MSKSIAKQAGLSLIELMISMTLGLLVMAGIITAFISSKTVYITHQAMSQVQDSARLALGFLEDDIRMAGYFGCGSRSSKTVTNTLKESSIPTYDFNVAIQGYTEVGLDSSDTLFNQTPLVGTEILFVKSTSGNGIPVSKLNESDRVFIENLGEETGYCSGNENQVSGFCEADIVVVSDCSKASVFQISEIETSGSEVALLHGTTNHTPGNAVTSWGGLETGFLTNYQEGSKVSLANSSAYYIAEGSFSDYSLWKNENGVDIELLEGIENISFRYGEITSAQTNAAPDEYRTSDQVENWDKVVAVEIELLVTSVADNVVAEPQPYVFNGITVTPEDRRLRRVFKNTIGIRGRLS